MPAYTSKVTQIAAQNKLGAACLVLVWYFVFEYVRPHAGHLLGFLQPLKIPMFLVIALFIMFFRNEKSLLKDRLVIYVLLFILLVGFSVTYARNTFYVWGTFKNLSVIIVATMLVMPVIFGELAKLVKFSHVWVLINVFLALHALKYGGRGPGGFTADENDMALVLNMAIPYPIYLLLSGKYGNKGRILLTISTLLLVIGSGATMSRGGFLGLVAVFGMVMLLSRRRLKSIGVIVLIVAIAGYPVYLLVPDKYKTEVSSISDTQDSTRESRIEFWGYGWDMFLDNPFLGVGAANYPWTVHLYQMRKPGFDPDRVTLFGGRPAHSLYFSLIPELGLAGIILFVLILSQMVDRLRRIIRMGVEYPALAQAGLLAKAMLVSMVAYLVTGAFISVLYYPQFWYLIAFVLTLDRAVNAEYEKIASEGKNAPEGDTHNRNGRARGRGKHPGAGRPRLAGRV